MVCKGLVAARGEQEGSGRGRTEEGKVPSHQCSAMLGKSCQCWRPRWIKDKVLALMFSARFVQTQKVEGVLAQEAG